MTRADIKQIVASEFAQAKKTLSKGKKMVINAEGRIRRAKKAMEALNMDMEMIED